MNPESNVPFVAWCWATGLIEMGTPPESLIAVNRGAIPFATGPKASLVAEVEVAARHGRGASTGKLLVPGIPEAADEEAGLAALEAFVAWCANRPGPYKGVCWAIKAERGDGA